jgi:hypothetical protein
MSDSETRSIASVSAPEARWGLCVSIWLATDSVAIGAGFAGRDFETGRAVDDRERVTTPGVIRVWRLNMIADSRVEIIGESGMNEAWLPVTDIVEPDWSR